MYTMKIGRIICAALIAILAVAITTTPVHGADVRAGDTVSLSEDEQVYGDLYLAGRVISSSATVIGDIFAAGETLKIAGSVDGGLTAAGQTIVVDGVITRGARLAGSSVDVAGHVERDLLVGSGVFTLEPEASIGQDLLFGAGTVVLRGEVGGNVRGGAEELIIEGTVTGNVDVEVGTLVIGPGANVGGDLTYSSRTEADIPADTVQGSISYSPRIDDRIRSSLFGGLEALAPLAVLASILWKVAWYLMTLVVGIVLILLAPRRMAGAATALRTDTGPVAGWGAIALFVTPLAAILVCLTIIGLPLGIIALLLWGILLYLSQLPVSLFIGQLILGHQKPLASKGFMIGSLALGLLILTLLRSIPLLGFLVWLAIALFGLGAFVTGERQLLQSRRNSSGVSSS